MTYHDALLEKPCELHCRARVPGGPLYYHEEIMHKAPCLYKPADFVLTRQCDLSSPSPSSVLLVLHFCSKTSTSGDGGMKRRRRERHSQPTAEGAVRKRGTPSSPFPRQPQTFISSFLFSLICMTLSLSNLKIFAYWFHSLLLILFFCSFLLLSPLSSV